MNQSELVTRLKQGDAAAFKTVVELWQDMVYNTVLGIVQNAEDAEDITQEVFVQVYQSISSFKEEAKLSTWIYRISITKALDHERKKKRKKRFAFVRTFLGTKEEEQIHPVEFYHPGVQLDNKEKAAVLFKALQQLPENQRVAFTLNKIEGLSNQEIADIMKITLYATESLMTRAKANLKKELQEYYSKRNN